MVALCVATALSTMVVHRVILDEGTYAAALADADAYERFYTEVLPDPDMVGVQDALLGGVRLPPALTTQVRALTTNAVRWAVPPATLQAGTETALAGTMAFLRGETDELHVEIDLVPIAERVEDGVRTRVGAALAAIPGGETIRDLRDYRRAVASVVADLEQGVLPESLPRFGGADVPAEEVASAIVDALGDRADARLADLVTAAVAAGRERDGLIAAVSQVGAARAERITADWDDGSGPVVDLALRLEERAQTRADSVVDSLNWARRLAMVFRPATALLAVAAAVAAVVGLWFVHRDAPARAVVLVGVGLVGGGVVMLLLWSVIAGLVGEPLDLAVAPAPDGWDLPEAVRALLVDVRTSLAATTRAAVLWRVAGAVIAGAVLIVVAAGLRLPAARGVRSNPILAAGGALAVVLGLGVVFGAPSSAEADRRCNGHVELCERRYDQVVQGATHNAMSSPDVVQIWPEHDGDLRSQLDAGVRTLLIDTHHWTALSTAEQLLELDPDLPPELAEVLLRMVAPFAEARDGSWLCHNHCAFGGEPFIDGMAQVRAFLEDNPHDVVTLIIQDAIPAAETAEVLRDAGLEPYLHVHDADEPWATYDELIDAGERLIVFAENGGPPPAWHMNAFEAMQETPFTVLSPDRFTCEPNRGDPDATLFLLNHWVQRVAPDRADSVIVNAHDVIVDRARRCEEERGLLPTFIAVNFYSIGDLMGAVDTLNGVG